MGRDENGRLLRNDQSEPEGTDKSIEVTMDLEKAPLKRIGMEERLSLSPIAFGNQTISPRY
jgi:hypothetical protein